MKLATWLCVVSILAFAAPTMAAPVLGQIDDFEDGTTQGWTVGAQSPFPPTNIPTGGPAGVNDNYLELHSDPSNPSAPAGSNLGTFNTTQWAGDYVSAGVTAIEMEMANFGATDLEMRLFICGPNPGGCFSGAFTTTLAQALPADSLWHTLVFDISPAALTSVGGADPLVALGGVTQLLLRHDEGAPSPASGSTPVLSTAGVDNIQAVPEPATLVLLAFGGICLLRRRKQ